MSKINLNESYLHSVVMSSINRMLNEDMEQSLNNTMDYENDIRNGSIDEIEDNVEYNGERGLTRVCVFGADDAQYDIYCYANRTETSPYIPAKLGSSYDEYEPDVPAEYDYDLEIVAVERFDENMNEYEDITSYLNIESLNEWLDYTMDWDELYDNRNF
jgi:hypothetical protein